MQPQEEVKRLIEALNRLLADRVAEVADFVEFLKTRDLDRGLARAALRTSEPLLAELWGNSEDAAYDEL